ncbi:uncharacterized protein TA12400 [Theileria annulata]|uniref:Nas2 N-terminal domain-containing protein n=1 Tax=Theileria annulata TaxID=5874 RepID=Q4UE00_THEAN|nr:uncharacterized protein TA12400 [Theileria annulata]CAI74689.1 hypothetical protein, conserved [Theileria annulata]|eukprot:XP_952421.1 hypothetical protein, conserved [Theileria annulata]
MSNIMELDKARKDIEIEMEALMSYLNSEECKYVGLTGPLVDNEQFPRNDIDIYEVRKARGRIMCLKNDYQRKLNNRNVGDCLITTLIANFKFEFNRISLESAIIHQKCNTKLTTQDLNQKWVKKEVKIVKCVIPIVRRGIYNYTSTPIILMIYPILF